jgi:arginine N-succinyltransferase
MLVLRNALETDLDAVFELAKGVGPGMTTLKAERGALRERLAVAAASFSGELAPADADYVFVLEDLAAGRVCGVSAIKAAVGVREPFYNYRISTSVHASPTTGLVNRVQSLHLSHDLSGASELCSLYLHPDYRSGSNGRLLSKGRLLFMAQFPSLFGSKVFAEMRGFQDGQGRSPFWEAVGRPFFHMDFHEADVFCGNGDRLFFEHLVPRLPLYTHLLGLDACAAIGKTHADTASVRRLHAAASLSRRRRGHGPRGARRGAAAGCRGCAGLRRRQPAAHPAAGALNQAACRSTTEPGASARWTACAGRARRTPCSSSIATMRK